MDAFLCIFVSREKQVFIKHFTFMAKYIKQEMIDLSGKGEEKVYYRLQTERNIDFEELTQQIEHHHKLMNRGLVKRRHDLSVGRNGGVAWQGLFGYHRRIGNIQGFIGIGEG